MKFGTAQAPAGTRAADARLDERPFALADRPDRRPDTQGRGNAAGQLAGQAVPQSARRTAGQNRTGHDQARAGGGTGNSRRNVFAHAGQISRTKAPHRQGQDRHHPFAGPVECLAPAKPGRIDKTCPSERELSQFAAGICTRIASAPNWGRASGPRTEAQFLGAPAPGRFMEKSRHSVHFHLV